MKRAVAVIIGIAMLCVVAYLSWLNPTAAEFRFTPTRQVEAPLGALMIFAFLVGALLVLAMVAIQAGRRALAAWRHERGHRRSERIASWEERGEQLVWNGQLQQGRALLQKAWQRRPGNAHALLALAASYRDTGELQRARALLVKAASQHQTNPEVLYALAQAHRAAGDLLPCIDVLERLRALRPRAPRVLRALRDRYVDTDRWQEAATLQEALVAELRDSDQAARERDYLLALRYQVGVRLRDPRARVQALEALADGYSASVPILVSLGEALLAEGREDEASVVWERALRRTPRTVLVERLVGIATEPRHRERLRSILRKLRADKVQQDNLRLLLAQLHLADGAVDEAAKELEAIARPANAPALLQDLQAQVHSRRGQLEQAVAVYARCDNDSAPYHCIQCDRTTTHWAGFCTACKHWDSYRSAVEIALQ
ncbi:MAG: tetratricopeptide repeat protein [Candidatus Binatia bacterium]